MNWCFELWCWGRLLKVPWTVRRSNQSILKEISPEYSLEGLMNIQSLWSWSSNTFTTWCKEVTYWKRSFCWERLKAEEKGTAGCEMVGWHHQLNRHEFEQAPGVDDGQGGLACCSPWGHKQLDTSKQLNWNDRRLAHTSTITFLFTIILFTLIHNIIPFALYKINIKTIHMDILCCVLELIITWSLSYFFKCLFVKFVNSYSQDKMPQRLNSLLKNQITKYSYTNLFLLLLNYFFSIVVGIK